MKSLTSNVFLLSIPLLSGLCTVLYAKLVTTHPLLSALSNTITFATVLVIVYVFRDSFPTTGKISLGWVFWLNTVLTAVLSFCWIFSMRLVEIPVISFVEMLYPIFVLGFTMLLLGKVNLNPMHYAGAGLMFVGTALILLGNTKSHL